MKENEKIGNLFEKSKIKKNLFPLDDLSIGKRELSHSVHKKNIGDIETTKKKVMISNLI